jgi:hypothetical protein
LVGISAAACSPISTLAVPSNQAGPASGELAVQGDWNDVTASVYAAIRDQEVAMLSELRSEGRIEFEFMTAQDEPVTLVAVRTGEGDEGVTITLTSRFGHFGDPMRERKFMERVASRLRDLAGVDYRPIR